MSSKQINWDSPLSTLVNNRKSKSLDKLIAQGLHYVSDLLWIIPLRTQKVSPVSKFTSFSDGDFVQGIAKNIAFNHKANFRAKGKSRPPLSNITITAQDRFSPQTISLKWFNCYPSQVQNLKETKTLYFTGAISSYMGTLQIVSADIKPIESSEFEKDFSWWQERLDSKIKVTYPTYAGVSPAHLKGLIDKIPNELWTNIQEYLPQEIIDNNDLMNLKNAFCTLHAKGADALLEERYIDQAKNRLIYEEFFQEQVKLKLRKSQHRNSSPILIESNELEYEKSRFPYELTFDQKTSLDDVLKDLQSGYSMMRLIQGDVGSGKTTIAILAALSLIKSGYQVAFMCPTESLALQHFLSTSEIFANDINIECLVGSLKKSEKDVIYEQIKLGEIDLIIGTHALIQQSVQFKNLGLAIIDEQHKFGVEQRLKLTNKSEGVHCLLMSATPIPRSLSLTQYGDLDISIIKSMPIGRKGTQTRIVTAEHYEKYLSFIKTRINMKEQAYVVVPAIEENEEQDILNLEQVLVKYKEYFPELTIEGLHGRLKAQEKNDCFIRFREKKIDILISTSVIEVGINNPNATIMSILSPERFGLSSLHQMRGRVGRGDKPGFCFLVNDKRIAQNSMHRLKVIESTTDGFKISEEDLKIRGEGNIFGTEQSGVRSTKVLASIIDHQDTLERARIDVDLLEDKYPNIFNYASERAKQDEILYKTV